MKKIIILLVVFLAIFGCSNSNNEVVTPENSSKNLTIFFINDQHGELNNFAKIKYIVDQEKLKTNVIIACSGDIFSGNPVVDNNPEKGYPMIDIMNQVGFDISVIGNHEYDYGEEIFKNRLLQANFDWICANVDMAGTDVPQPTAYKSIIKEDLKVTFLGLVETNGKDDATIPSTHPWRVQNFVFERPENVVNEYATIKERENADLYIALTHIGYSLNNGRLGDEQLALEYPYFDLIIGGHSHQVKNEVINNIPIFQSGSSLRNLGKIELKITNKKIESIDYELIDLNSYTKFDADLKAVIDAYNNLPYLNEIIGYSENYHNRSEVGCFVTEANKQIMNVDVSFQNTGGVRANLDQGDITKREIFEILPFNNTTVTYNMSIAEIKTFLKGSGSGFYYSGIQINQIGNLISIKNLSGEELADDTILSIGVNDYIPAVYDAYFPLNGISQTLNDAETVISYLEKINSNVNYAKCNNYFKYQYN